MESPKFRANYSVLAAWARGQWQEALKMYFRLPHTVTPQMLEGRQYHAGWQQEIGEHSRLPAVFGGRALEDPSCEVKREVQLYDWLDLVGTIDCYARPVIYEFKSGLKSSSNHLGDYQLAVYGVLATLSGLYVERAEIYHYDQHKQRADMSLFWLTPKALRRGLNWIETMAAEMHQYLLENGLYSRLGPKVADAG